MNNIELAAGLREMAAFYETHPNAPTPSTMLYIFCYSREEFLKAALSLATDGCIKKTVDPPDSYSQYHATRHFGAVSVDVQISRSLVCRLIRAAEYECPDSLLEDAKEFTEVAG